MQGHENPLAQSEKEKIKIKILIKFNKRKEFAKLQN